MGTPLPPNVEGDLCSVVFGPGGRFEGRAQPKYVTLQFSGFTPGQAFDLSFQQTLLTPQLLIQETNPCQYRLIVGGQNWFLWWRAGSTIVSIEEDGGIIEFFRGDITVNGALEVLNELTDGINVATLDGQVDISWVEP